jgi:hypothetical protein
MQQVEIKDYSAQLKMVMTAQGPDIVPTWDPRAEMTLAYNDRDSKWNPVRLRAFDQDKKEYADFKLTEDEELNATSLNGLKTALDDLKIVDVARKPQGLSEDLKAGEDFMKSQEALQDLISRGFTPARVAPGGPQDIISSDGEVIATLKNGTEYVLRFGALVHVDEDGGKADKADPATAAAKQDAKAGAEEGGIHRYLFVMARFNEDAVKKPELETLPELPAGIETKTAGEPASAGGTAATNSDTKSSDKQQEESPPSPQVTEESAPAQQDKAEAKQQPADKAATPATDAKDQAETEKQSPDKSAELDKIIAERKRIETENQRKLDEYQATLKKGRENVKDLNLRFGDWYFVVGNDVFKKIRLSRGDVVKKKEVKADPASKQDGKALMPNLPGGLMLPGSDPNKK